MTRFETELRIDKLNADLLAANDNIMRLANKKASVSERMGVTVQRFIDTAVTERNAITANIELLTGSLVTA